MARGMVTKATLDFSFLNSCFRPLSSVSFVVLTVSPSFVFGSAHVASCLALPPLVAPPLPSFGLLSHVGLRPSLPFILSRSVRSLSLAIDLIFVPHWTCSSSFLKPQPPGQPIGVTVHSTQQPIREQLLSSKPRQKLLKIYHPDEAQKPRLPDPIVQPIAVMPLSRT
ncbi:hypothetical protein TNCV_407901 [Trichonephila clavipes]|nr:hypothetical protein TNCV_407901 [Trichonephila clavipes]